MSHSCFVIDWGWWPGPLRLVRESSAWDCDHCGAVWALTWVNNRGSAFRGALVLSVLVV